MDFMMIKNVVFDFGMVLVSFVPEYMVRQYVTEPEEDVELLCEVIFDRLYWDCLDEGSITDWEVLAAIKKRIPERLWSVSETIYHNWIYNIPEIEGMRELVRYVKEKYGVKLFLLSNISRYFALHADEIPILGLFDRCIFSAVCQKVKPNREIFEQLCVTCDIKPEETLFIDDSEKNIRGAENYGICGYLFDGDAERLRAYFDQKLSKQ